MYVQMAGDRLNDRRDGFGIFEYHSCPRVHRSLGVELSMFPLQIEGTWHVRLDQSYAMLARTIESNNFFINFNFKINFNFFYLNRCRLIFMIFSVCTQIFNVDIWQTGDEQLKLLFIEDRNESLRDDVVESFKECIQSKKIKIKYKTLINIFNSFLTVAEWSRSFSFDTRAECIQFCSLP